MLRLGPQDTGRRRQAPWPAPYDETTHELRQGEARNLSHIDDATVHLVVTSPPYWTLKEYPKGRGQSGAVERSQEGTCRNCEGVFDTCLVRGFDTCQRPQKTRLAEPLYRRFPF